MVWYGMVWYGQTAVAHKNKTKRRSKIYKKKLMSEVNINAVHCISEVT